MKTGMLVAMVLAAAVSQSAMAQNAEKRDPNVLLAAEIAAQSNISYAVDAIRQLRPKFLRYADRSRGPEADNNAVGPVLYVDECKECGGGLVELGRLKVAEIVEIKFVEPSKAMALYGSDHRNGAIFVTTISRQPKP
jgi:hypothetical protein